MSSALRLLCILGAFLTGATAVRGTDFYVAPGGSNTNPGTLAAPWRTIQKAANSLAPGDRVLVRAGVYPERVTINVSGSAAGGPVTFENFPGETPVIDGSALIPPETSETALILVKNRSYVTIRGFEVRNYRSASVRSTPAGIFLRGACTHVEILNCQIHHIVNTAGTPANPGNAFGIAVYGSALTPASDLLIDGNTLRGLKTGASESLAINGNVTRFQVSNNLVHDNNNIGIVFIGFEGTCPDPAQDQARDGICRGNRVWNISSQGNQAYATGDFSADGIYCDGASGVLIEANVVYQNDIGFELASEHAGKQTSGIVLRNNLAYRNRQTGLFLGGYARTGTGGTSNCTITGNTFYQNDTLRWDNGQLQIRYRTSNCTVRGNLFCAGPGNWLASVPVGAAHNVNNQFDYNLFFAPAGAGAALWSWNNVQRTGFAAWQNAGASDAHGLFADPKFVAPASTPPDFHLQAGSPAIDAGDPAFVPASGETDLDGQARMSGSRVDLGAEEFTPPAGFAP